MSRRSRPPDLLVLDLELGREGPKLQIVGPLQPSIEAPPPSNPGQTRATSPTRRLGRTGPRATNSGSAIATARPRGSRARVPPPNRPASAAAQGWGQRRHQAAAANARAVHAPTTG